MLCICLNTMELETIEKKYPTFLFQMTGPLGDGTNGMSHQFGFVIKPPNVLAIVVGWAAKSSNRYTWPLLSENWRFRTEKKYCLKERINKSM